MGASAAGPTDQCDARYGEVGKDSCAWYGSSGELKRVGVADGGLQVTRGLMWVSFYTYTYIPDFKAMMSFGLSYK